MANRDGTGPMGLGKLKGKGLGPCNKIENYYDKKDEQVGPAIEKGGDKLKGIVDKILKK